MGYLAIARKWRPSRFEDLVGQEPVVQTLKNSILLNRVGHAYLLSGARGVGKTSVARIFAKALRCPNAKEANPCNACPECKLINDSRSVDVMEIDGASNNGVEAIRNIRENTVYGASSGFYKVYIIDEVHMLSISAFNALLKTLEEPPEHVVFIFATTEVQKLPLTILSRCQRFEFRRLSSAQIIARLKTILEDEKLKISDEGLRILASHSDGSLRDALSLLDQVISFLGGDARTIPIDEKTLVKALGLSESHQTTEFWSRVFSSNTQGILELIGTTYNSGVDLKHFMERCLAELRLIYLLRASQEEKLKLTANELEISQGHLTQLTEISNKVALVRLERAAQIVGRTIQQLNWVSLPRFVVEMAALRITKLENLDNLEKIEAKCTEIQATSISPPSPSPPPPIQSQVVQHENKNPQEKWKSFVDLVLKKRPLLGALLCHAKFKIEASQGTQSIVLAFPQGSFYERQATESRNRLDIENGIRQYFGPNTVLKISTSTEATLKSLEQTQREQEAHLKKEALAHPLVAATKNALDAELVEVKIETPPL